MALRWMSRAGTCIRNYSVLSNRGNTASLLKNAIEQIRYYNFRKIIEINGEAQPEKDSHHSVAGLRQVMITEPAPRFIHFFLTHQYLTGLAAFPERIVSNVSTFHADGM